MPQPPILEASELPPDAVEVGRITDAWGVKGWFKVLPYSSDPEALLASRAWFLQPAERGAKSFFAGTVLLPIRQARTHSDTIVAWAQGVDDRDGAEALRGARIFVPRASFPAAGDDEYYWVDLIGLEVVNREGEPLGTVAEMIDTGPHCVMRLEQASTDAAGKARTVERMIPFVAAYIDGVDLPGRRITADWGLDY